MMSSLRFRLHTFLKYKDLLSLLVERDIKLKYRRSALGYIWSILNPLLSMLVMVIVFSHMFSRGIENYPVYLICGNILFNFLRDSSTQAMHSIVSNAAMLKKIYVPKYIFTLSRITSSFVNLLFSLGALLIVMIITRIRFSWINLMMIIPIVELYVFCVGLGLFLAAANVFFRDISNIWNVVTLAWMYLTPIFYSLESTSPMMRRLIPQLNPMYLYVTQMRAFVMSRAWPDPILIGRGALIAVLMLALGLFVFTRTKDEFILHI